ncbi:MAG: pyridoxal phosphate-dependent aminotransferase family protein [Planctomycetes bacterium]|nr:pyridoxal phosphate-dependent aminotransferase family protein [Planctomycetota bacterium]
MRRELPALSATGATSVQVDGVDLLSFHGCGYLGLAHDPRVRAAAAESIERFGLSGLASRNTSGNLELHERLEQRLAEFLGTEAALVLADGYLADIAAAQALARDADRACLDQAPVALHDDDVHPSILDALASSGFRAFGYGAGDMSHALALLDLHKDRAPLVATDGAFAMHGRLAPAAELLRHLPTNAHLLIDDSHGVGVLGRSGRGVVELFGLDDPRIVLTGSLAKALGSGGGFVAGSADKVEAVRRRTSSFAGTTALSPPLAAAALTSLDLIDAEPERLERLRANVGQLHRSARRVGLRSTGTFLPVLRITMESEDAARRLSSALHVEGIFAPAIRYHGATGQGMVRCAVTSEHTAAELRRLEEALVRHLPEGSPGG